MVAVNLMKMYLEKKNDFFFSASDLVKKVNAEFYIVSKSKASAYVRNKNNLMFDY